MKTNVELLEEWNAKAIKEGLINVRFCLGHNCHGTLEQAAGDALALLSDDVKDTEDLTNATF